MFRPHAVLLDGVAVCRQMRGQAWGADMRVIALTGWSQDADRRRSSEAGFDAPLVKPVEHAALIHALAGTAAGLK